MLGWGPAPCFFLLCERINLTMSGWKASPTSDLYNSEKLCKSFGYIGCKEDKWDCKERGKGRCFQKGNALDACPDYDKVEREWEGFDMFEDLCGNEGGGREKKELFIFEVI